MKSICIEQANASSVDGPLLCLYRIGLIGNRHASHWSTPIALTLIINLLANSASICTASYWRQTICTHSKCNKLIIYLQFNSNISTRPTLVACSTHLSRSGHRRELLYGSFAFHKWNACQYNTHSVARQTLLERSVLQYHGIGPVE